MVSETGKDFYAFTLNQKMRYKYYVNDHRLLPDLHFREQLFSETEEQQALSPWPRRRPWFPELWISSMPLRGTWGALKPVKTLKGLHW